MNDRAIESEFLTARGAATYQSAIAAAAQLVAITARAPRAPGFVSGSGSMRRTVRALDLATPDGVGLDRALTEAGELLAAHSTWVTHPRYAAHLHCPATVSSLAAEVLVSATNQSMDSFDQAPIATVIEEYVVEWLCGLLGYAAGDGVFTSGGTQSNLQAMLLARDRYAATTLGWNIAEQGLPPEASRWRILCTDQTHFTIEQAARVLGLGRRSVVRVGTDADGRLDPQHLRTVVDDCAASGTPVFAIVATVGTTDLGIIDPVGAIAAVAREHGIWVHADAAAGGCLLLSKTHDQLVEDLGAADSVTIDFHKLLFQSISCGALLVRDRAALRILAAHVDYLNPADDDPDETPNLVWKSLQTTRRFDALKVFVTLRSLGTDAVAALIDRTIATAHAASSAAAAHPDVELVQPAATNSVLLRWTAPDASGDELDRVNNEIRRRLAADGRTLVGRTRAAGVVVLKLTFVNPVCSPDIARSMVDEIAAVGNLIAAENRGEVRTDAVAVATS